MDALIESAAQITLHLLGRKTVAMIISGTGDPQFAKIYWTQYLQPRRQAFTTGLERAKARNEVDPGLDAGLVFDAISGIMLYAMLFQQSPTAWAEHVRRTIQLLFGKASE